jgi:hypothetical protein
VRAFAAHLSSEHTARKVGCQGVAASCILQLRIRKVENYSQRIAGQEPASTNISVACGLKACVLETYHTSLCPSAECLTVCCRLDTSHDSQDARTDRHTATASGKQHNGALLMYRRWKLEPLGSRTRTSEVSGVPAGGSDSAAMRAAASCCLRCRLASASAAAAAAASRWALHAGVKVLTKATESSA